MQLVQRMAEQLPSNKLQVVFLINNYHEVTDACYPKCLLLTRKSDANSVFTFAGFTAVLSKNSIDCSMYIVRL